MMRSRWFFILAAAGLALAWGCSKQVEYPQAAKDNFMASCLGAARDTLGPESGGADAEQRARAYCSCNLEKVMKDIPYYEFAAIDKNMREKGAIDPAMERKLQQAMSECRAQSGIGK